MAACAAVRGVLRIARSQELTGDCSEPSVRGHQENIFDSGILGRWKVAYYH